MNEKQFLNDYFHRLYNALPIDSFQEEIIRTRDIFLKSNSLGGQIILVGNGGSAAIASHVAIDLAKNAKLKATAFNDASLITCLANDYGHENWMSSAIKIFSHPNDCVVAISSSGNSQNIINASNYAINNGMSLITFSGMQKNNKLRNLGKVNFLD